MEATIVIGVFGDDYWMDLATKVALPSIHAQTVRPHAISISYHETSLSEARNFGAERAETEWLCFVDADDALDSRYIEHMLAAEGDIRRPSTIGFYEDGTEDSEPVLIPRANLKERNYIVIGSFVRREQFLKVGGFRNLPVLEDWDLWIRCVRDGATVTDVPEAIYRVGVHPDSRNQNTQLHHKVYNDIRRTYW